MGLLYVYAVVRADTPVGARRLSGLHGADIHEVDHGRLRAVVSPIGDERVRPARAHVLAHQQVVSALHDDGPVLPVRFGTVIPGADEVVDALLEPEGDRFEGLLHFLDGKDEYRLKARYRPDVALQEAAHASPAIQALRKRAHTSNQGAQIQLGELVVAALRQLRERDEATILGRLAPSVSAIQPLDARSDEVPLHVALLVDCRRMRRLEKVLNEIGRAQEDRLELELIGPLPPWDFSELEGTAV
jgi:hypothetical protein